MTPFNPNGSGASFHKLIVFDKFDGFEVCWAGRHPFEEGFCFGSEDGRLLYTDELGVAFTALSQGSASGEAINGVAVVGKCLAVSTRADITFWTEISPTEKKGGWSVVKERSVVPVGSHGIAALPSGSFVAPIGLAGLMKAIQTPDGFKAVIVTPHPKSLLPKDPLYLYRISVLRNSVEQQTLVCAIRRGGIGFFQFSSDDRIVAARTITYPDLDIVDVCALDAGGNSLAVGAVGTDGTLILFRNVQTDTKPVTMRFRDIKGKAYRLLSCRGHIFLLTSMALYVIANVADRVRWGESMSGGTIPIMGLPMEAVDANLYQDKFLLIVLAENKVLRLDLALMETTIPENLGHNGLQQLSSMSLDLPWEEHGVEQDLREVGVG